MLRADKQIGTIVTEITLVLCTHTWRRRYRSCEGSLNLDDDETDDETDESLFPYTDNINNPQSAKKSRKGCLASAEEITRATPEEALLLELVALEESKAHQE